MKKLYIVGIVLIVGLILLAVVRFGIGPRPVGIMKPSFFDQPQEIGIVAYRRLFDPLTRQPLIVFGITPEVPEHRAVVEGFLIAAKEEKYPITVVYRERHLDPIQVPEGTEVIEFEFNSGDAALADQIRAHISQGKRVLLYTASVLSSHLIKGNTIHRFEALWGKPVYSISTVGIAVRRDQEVKIEPPCIGSERDTQGTASLGCAAMLKGRTLYRKNIDNSRFVALMDQRGFVDMLLFVSIPPAKREG